MIDAVRLVAWMMLALCFGASGESFCEAPRGIEVGHVAVWEDPGGDADLEQALAHRKRFHRISERIPNYHYTKSAFWFRIAVENERESSADLYLKVGHPLLDSLRLYTVSGGSRTGGVRSGDRVPAIDRPVPGAVAHLFPFRVPGEASVELYLRVRSRASLMIVPLEVIDRYGVEDVRLSDRMIMGVLLGLFGALFVYNLLVFALLRERTYLYYVLYLVVTFFTVTALNGRGAVFLYPRNTWPANEGLMLFSGLSYVLILLFIREFLKTRGHALMEGILKTMIGVSVLSLFSPFYLPIQTAYHFASLLPFLFPIVSLGIGIVAWKQGRTEARFFVIGQASSWIGLMVFGFMINGVLDFHPIVFESVTIGISADALLLSLALADRIRIEQRARLRAEDAARRNLEIRQEELKRLVDERTAEIQTLKGIIPICMYCKTIRDDQGYWSQLEQYISEHSDAQFSHGICPKCLEERYPEEDDEEDGEEDGESAE
jgi:hypothetical protein